MSAKVESAKTESINPIASLFRTITLGVYAVGVTDGQRRDAFTAAWIMQASFEPLILAVSINPDNASYELLHATGSFTVNVLKQTQLELAHRLGTRSGRDEDKLAGIRSHPGRLGSPILDDALAYFECELLGRTRAGDHELVLGRVVDGKILDAAAVPLTYADTGEMDGSAALFPKKF
jgi:flavin reductase (DIM6/NTAB) family NADH-FMN oxidoreductase RutF